MIRDLYVTVVATVLRSTARWARCWWRCSASTGEWRWWRNDFPGSAGGNGDISTLQHADVRRVRAYLADINDGFNEIIMA